MDQRKRKMHNCKRNPHKQNVKHLIYMQKNEIEQIKQKFGPESYITSCLSSCTAGILPLAITFGRLKHIQEENRLCELCDLGGESPIFSCTAHTMKNVSFPQNGSTKP